MPISKSTGHWRRLAGRWFSLWLPALMLGWLPILADFLENRYQVSIQDLLLPLLLGLITATLLSLIFYWRASRLGSFLAVVIASAILAFNYEARLSGILPVLKAVTPLPGLQGLEGPVYSLLFLTIIILVSGWLGGQWAALAGRRRGLGRELAAAVALAICVTFLTQFVPSLRALAGEWPQFWYTPPKLAATTTATGSKPDIYYIVLDRYASNSVLSSQFGFDNSDFSNFLASKDYTVNPNAHQNYPYTTMSISSTLNANYQTDLVNRFGQTSLQTIIPYHRAIQYAAVTKQLKALGYQFTQIGTWYEATNQAPLTDTMYQKTNQLRVFGHDFTLNSFSNNELTQSWYWRFVQAGLGPVASYSSQYGPEQSQYSLQTLRTLAGGTSGGRFIFAHILVPHDPYYFNADGSLSPNSNSDNVGEQIKQKYLGQITFINNQMKGILTTIDQSSHGQAVVILQADEGPYPIQLNQQVFNQSAADEEVNTLDMRTWSDQDLSMKYGNLAAYHVPAATAGDLASGGDNLNIFRVVFNSYFGAAMPYLTRCYYAYPNGRQKPLVYADITDRLTGQANPACAADGSGPR